MPVVTVIIPTYKSHGLLQRAVAQVLAQTMTDLECIIVSDGSDEDFDWISHVSDRRVRLVRTPNRGVSAARNFGASLSDGQMLAFLDQDDEWLPEKLELQVRRLNQLPGAAFAYTAFEWAWDGRRLAKTYDEAVDYRNLLSHNMVALSSCMVRATHFHAVGGFDPLYRQVQDFDLFLKLARLFDPPALVPEVLTRINIHDSNASKDYFLGFEERRAVVAAHRRLAVAEGDSRTIAACRQSRSTARRIYGAQALDDLRMTADRNAFQVASTFQKLVRINPRLAVAAPFGLIRRVRQRIGLTAQDQGGDQ